MKFRYKLHYQELLKDKLNQVALPTVGIMTSRVRFTEVRNAVKCTAFLKPMCYPEVFAATRDPAWVTMFLATHDPTTLRPCQPCLQMHLLFCATRQPFSLFHALGNPRRAAGSEEWPIARLPEPAARVQRPTAV